MALGIIYKSELDTCAVTAVLLTARWWDLACVDVLTNVAASEDRKYFQAGKTQERVCDPLLVICSTGFRVPQMSINCAGWPIGMPRPPNFNLVDALCLNR